MRTGLPPPGPNYNPVSVGAPVRPLAPTPTSGAHALAGEVSAENTTGTSAQDLLRLLDEEMGQREAGVSRQSSLEADLEQAKDIEEEAEWPRLREDGKTYEFKGGSTWCGDALQDGMPAGQGVFATKRGCTFRSWLGLGPGPNGFFKNGTLNGYGNITKPSGYAYTGQCWRNNPHGKGLLCNTDTGYQHDGGFYEGVANGPGIEKTHEFGTRVTTEAVWNMGQKSGLGLVTERFSQGGKGRVRKRVGEFVSNKREGEWVETTEEAGHLVVHWKGKYESDLKNGPFKQVVYEPYGERTETVGSNKNGQYEGPVAICTYKGGAGCTGGLMCNYVHGVKSGMGVLDLGNGTRMTGEWLNDKQHGWFDVTVDGKPAERRWYEHGAEDRAKANRLKRRADRLALGKQKALKGCPGCTANSQKHCMRNFECERTHGGPDSNTDSASDAELEDIAG